MCIPNFTGTVWKGKEKEWRYLCRETTSFHATTVLCEVINETNENKIGTEKRTPKRPEITTLYGTALIPVSHFELKIKFGM